MAILTDAKARNIKPGDTNLAHGAITGLTLNPSKSKGHGKWVLRYVSPVTKSRRNAGLGSYPEVGIAEAGKRGMQFREQLALGIDPLAEKEREEQEAAKAVIIIPSFEEAARKLHAELLPGWKNEKHGKQWLSTLITYAFPVIGELAINQIQPGQIADVLRPIWQDKAETAGRLKQRLHAVFAWAWAHNYVQANPVSVVEHLLSKQAGKAVRTKHHPAMPWQEIPTFYAMHLNRRDSYDVTRALLSFVILTASRSGEARGMCWDEVDFENKIWTVPAERMKAGIRHRVPLSEPAILILQQRLGLHEKLVFASPRDQVELSDMVLTSFLRRVKATSDTEGRVATAHGFRSSFRDWCSENNYARDLAERALAHQVENKVEAAYHRTDLLEQRREMMQAWAYFLGSASI